MEFIVFIVWEALACWSHPRGKPTVDPMFYQSSQRGLSRHLMRSVVLETEVAERTTTLLRITYLEV